MTVMFIRSFILYALLLLVLRLMGKRQIGELQPSELVTTLLLSEIASQPITDDNIPLIYGIAPSVAVLAFEVILSFAITKNKTLKKIMTGNISILIEKGELNVEEMKKTRLSLEELCSELRLKGVCEISQVQYAVLEKNGKLSVILKQKHQPVTQGDFGIVQAEGGFDHALVSDGEIITENVACSGKTVEFIKDKLKECGIASVEDAMLMTCNDRGDVYIIKKGKEK